MCGMQELPFNLNLEVNMPCKIHLNFHSNSGLYELRNKTVRLFVFRFLILCFAPKYLRFMLTYHYGYKYPETCCYSNYSEFLHVHNSHCMLLKLSKSFVACLFGYALMLRLISLLCVRLNCF